MEKKTLGVIRGTRQSVIDFYRFFTQLEVRFIAASFKPFSFPTRDDGHFHLVNLPYYKPFGFDPAGLIKQRGNLSWIFIRDLEKNLAGSDLISLSDTYYFPHLQAIRWARKNQVPVVIVIWTTISDHITSWFPPYSWITQKVIEATDLFILRNKTALRFTDSLGIPRKKVKVIYKGVDLDKFKPAKKRKDKRVKILFTGNLSRAKGLDDLFSVFIKLKERHRNIRLIIAGDGEMRKEVERRAVEEWLDFRGFVDYQQLPRLYQEADIYCAPSKEKRFLGVKVWEEYFSYALMEAQASGLPIVATNSGGILEEIGEKNFLVAPGEQKGLFQALEKLILDSRLRKRLGQENRERAERLFDARVQARKTEEAMLEIA